ncbi:MAG TPA: hypothetical protein VKU92_02130 [Acidimicrobiales bacterium]|nr:hypothetical protein [Acidimicrobiales bacterium]
MNGSHEHTAPETAGSADVAARRCQRLVDSELGREQCPNVAAWTGTLHAGRDLYAVETCDRHRSGVIDAEPLDGDWDRL